MFDVGVDSDDLRILGVEFAVTPPGKTEVEVGMFIPGSADGVTLPRSLTNRNPQMGYPREYGVRVTLHTTDGDFTLRGNPGW